MAKKILIIDDSALMRRVLSGIINGDEHLTVADTASSAIQALELILDGKQYDTILVDIQMPQMNGVQFIRTLKKSRIQIPVLVVSSIAHRDASGTIEALELGAFDFVRKPTGSTGSAFTEFSESIISKVHSACGIEDLPVSEASAAAHKRTSVKQEETRPSLKKNAVKSSVPVARGKKLAVIASSTGGPKALQSVIPQFPANFPYPLVVVQHMPAGFTESLAVRLDELSQIRVKEAEDGEVLKKGVAYIAKGGKQCELVEEQGTGQCRISENDKPPRGGLKPCADIFLESLVDTSFEEIVCGVLTGMGSDGTKGILQIKQNKKMKVVAQDEATSVVYGMPKAVKVAGVADEVVPLEHVAETMIKQIGV